MGKEEKAAKGAKRGTREPKAASKKAKAEKEGRAAAKDKGGEKGKRDELKPSEARRAGQDVARHVCTGATKDGCDLVESNGELTCRVSGRVHGSVVVDTGSHVEKEDRENDDMRLKAYGAKRLAESYREHNFKHTRGNTALKSIVDKEAKSMLSAQEDHREEEGLDSSQAPKATIDDVEPLVNAIGEHLFSPNDGSPGVSSVRRVLQLMLATRNDKVLDMLRMSGKTPPEGVTCLNWLLTHPLMRAVFRVMQRDMIGVVRRQKRVFGGRAGMSVFRPAVMRFHELQESMERGSKDTEIPHLQRSK